MLTCFDLKPGVSLKRFAAAVDAYAELMRERDLLATLGPIGRRARNTILDTDEDKSQEYFFLMGFRDRAQSDAAISLIESGPCEVTDVHRAMYALADNMVFLCWEDVTRP